MFRKNGRLYLDDIEVIPEAATIVTGMMLSMVEYDALGHVGTTPLVFGALTLGEIVFFSYYSRWLERKHGLEYGTVSF